MTKFAITILMLCVAGNGQNARPADPPQSIPLLKSNLAPSVGPETAVITLNGVCNPIPKEKSSENCTTVITRKQFELMVLAVQRDMPPEQRRQFAQRYVEALINDQKTRELGLDKGPAYDEQIKFANEQILAQKLNLAIFDKSPGITDKEVEDFYRSNLNGFKEAVLTRIAIPRRQKLPEAADELSDAEQSLLLQNSEAAIKTEANKLRVRALAGEDFVKLQSEAFLFAGAKDNFPDTNLGKIRGSSLQANQRVVMDLKPGEISQVLSDPNGFVIYKMGEKRTLTLDEVKREIRDSLGAIRQEAEMKSITDSAIINLDQTYFGK